MKCLFCVIFLSLFFISNLFADSHGDKKGYVIAFLNVHNKNQYMHDNMPYLYDK